MPSRARPSRDVIRTPARSGDGDPDSSDDDESSLASSSSKSSASTKSTSSTSSSSKSSGTDGSDSPLVRTPGGLRGAGAGDDGGDSSSSDSEQDDMNKLKGLELFEDDEGMGSMINGRRRSSVSLRISNKRRAVLEAKAGLGNKTKVEEEDQDRYSDSSDSSIDLPSASDDSGDDGDGGDNSADVRDKDGNVTSVSSGRDRRYALPSHGVPLETLKSLAKIVKKITKACDRAPMTTKEVVREVIMPLTALERCSFVDLLYDREKSLKAAGHVMTKKTEEYRGIKDKTARKKSYGIAKKISVPNYPIGRKYKANVFVCHGWNNKFVDLVEALESFQAQETEGDFKTTDQVLYFWMDVFCINQWKPIVGNGRCPPPIWFQTTFPEFMKTINWTVVVLMPWNKPVALHRTWCLYEIVVTMQNKGRVSMQFSKERHPLFLGMLEHHYDRARAVIDGMDINVDYSAARSTEAQEAIFETVFTRLDHGSMFAVNNLVSRALHTWSRAKTLHKLEIQFSSLRLKGESLRKKNKSSWTKLVRSSLFCNAFGCVEAFDKEEHIKDNDVAMLSLAQFIGRLYMEQEQYEQAEEYYKVAMQGSEKICGPNSPSTMILLGNIAVVFKKKGDMKEAETMFQRCLQRKEAVLGVDHESTLGTVLNIAAFLRENKRYKESIGMYKRALQVQEEQYGENHEVTLKTVEDLASVHLETGSTKDTLGLLLRILTSKTVQMGTDHPETLTVLENIADMYAVEENYELARDAYIKASRAREKVFGRNHPSTLAVYSNLAALEERIGDFAKARQYYDTMIDGVIKTLGRTHFRVYMIMDKQINCDVKTGSASPQQIYAMTYELFSKAENILTMEDPVAQTIAQHLADSLIVLKRYKEASIYFRKCYEARKKTIGSDESYTLVVQYGLAFSLAQCKSFKEAYHLFQDLVSRFDEHPDFGPEHPKTISTVRSYLDVCRISGDKNSVEALLRRLHKFYADKHGHEDEKTLAVVADLAKSYVA